MLTLMQSPFNNDDEDSGATGDKPNKKNVSMPDPFDTMHLTYLGGQLSVGAYWDTLQAMQLMSLRMLLHICWYSLFNTIFSLERNGKIQWSEILDQAEKALDRDGDGKFDIKDAKIGGMTY